MKTDNRIYAVLMVVLTTTLSCDKKEDSGERLQEVISKLVGKTWTIQSVVEEGIDRTLIYEGMTITFEQQSASSRLKYVTEKAGPVWAIQGTLDCQYAGRLEMYRDDNILCAVQSITDSELEIEVINFPYSIGPGRTESTGGNHVFTFSN
jgi:hypothetical protein